MAALLVRPSAGRVTFPEELAENPNAVKRRMAMVGHSTLLYDELSAAENLSFFARLLVWTPLPAPFVIHSKRAALPIARIAWSEQFSRGMRQRLGHRSRPAHLAELLLLDEPASGLDRQGSAWLSSTLAGLSKSGCTLIMSTHARNESLESRRAPSFSTRDAWSAIPAQAATPSPPWRRRRQRPRHDSAAHN